jgi:hypothetical protein
VSIAFELVLCSPGRATDSGGSQPITINFSVLDEKGQPVAHALVQIRLNSQLLASTPTDDHGKGSITVSSAGSYILNVSKKGYIKTESTLQVSADARAEEVDVILARAALSQQNIEVQGTVSNPVTEASSSQATLNPIQAKDAPSRPATLTDALPLVAGIVRGKDGSVRIAGYGEHHSALLVNSVNVTDPATGEFGLSVRNGQSIQNRTGRFVKVGIWCHWLRIEKIEAGILQRMGSEVKAGSECLSGRNDSIELSEQIDRRRFCFIHWKRKRPHLLLV